MSPPSPPSTQPPTNGGVVSPPSPPPPSPPTSEDRMCQERTKDVPAWEPSVDAVGEVTGERNKEGEFITEYTHSYTQTFLRQCAA